MTGPATLRLDPWSLRLDRPRRSLVWWTASPWRRPLGTALVDEGFFVGWAGSERAL